jgi:hypothetical protein
MSHTLMPFQPDQLSPAQLAAVSYLARYSGHTHTLYASQLRRWFGWCEANRLTLWSGSSEDMLSCTSGTWAMPV